MSQITARQGEILDAILRLTREKGYPPTIRELMSVMGFRSPQGVMCHLDSLKKKGRVTWERYLSRSLKVVGEDSAQQTANRIRGIADTLYENMRRIGQYPEGELRDRFTLNCTNTICELLLELANKIHVESQLQPGFKQNEPLRVQPGDPACGAGGVPAAGGAQGVAPRQGKPGERAV